jgi:guanylate kinase
MIRLARRGVCLVLSAPSGAGKTAITDALLASEPDLQRSVSVTTRQPRPDEIDGVHYHFVSPAAFRTTELDGALLESARVLRGTHAYGTPRAPVEQALAAGKDVIFDIDWQGHRTLREKLSGDVVGVFILPPDMNVLQRRLLNRAGDNQPEIARRMSVAREEISHWAEFDHVVINDDLQATIEAVRAVLRAARLETHRQAGLHRFVDGLC